jgi:hypothetical protein
MTTGSVTINGSTDGELIIILEAKRRHEGAFQFSPQTLKPVNFGGNPPKAGYDNAILTWHNQLGFELVMEVLHRISPETKCRHHEGPAAP